MENKPSEHLSNIFTITPTNGSAYLDNDTIKQTILAQEATFKEQVSELHRVYNVQKNLMALEFPRGELTGNSQEKMYSSPSGGIRTFQQVEPPAGHDMNKPSEKIMKGKELECSSNRVSMRHNNSRSTQKKLSLQVPAGAHADDSDDDVVIPLEKPAKRWPRTNGSILGSNAKDLQVPVDAHVDDSDDDVVILSEKPSKIFPRNNGSILGTNVKNLQVPASAHVDDYDDDVVILLERSAKSLPRNNGSIPGINVKLKIEGISHMNKKWIAGLQPSDVSTMNVLNKKVVGPSCNMKTTNFPSVGSSSSQNQFYSSAGVNLNLPNVKLEIEPSLRTNKNWVSGLQQSDVSTVNVFNRKDVGSSSTMKIADFPSVGASSSQNQGYSSPGVNLNLPSLEDTLEGKCVGAAFGSNFFVANGETRHNNSYGHTKYERSNGMECFAHEENGVDSSAAHDQSGCSIRNPQTFVATSSNAAFKSLWQSSTKDYTTRRSYADTELPIGQNSHLLAPKIAQLGGDQYQKHSQFYNCPKGVNLSNCPQDATATLGQAREDTPMEISWIRKKLLNMRKETFMKKSEVRSNCANGHPQILPGSIAYSEGTTRILGFPINATIEKDYQLSSTMHMGTDNTPSNKGVAKIEMQFQNKDDTNARNLIDLNVALPFMDDMEIDACPSEGHTIPQEPDDPSNEALAVTAMKNLMVVHKDDDSEALKLQMLKTKDRDCSSALLTQEHKRIKYHGSATTSSSNASDKANSSATTPLEGHYARYPGFKMMPTIGSKRT